MSRDVPSDPEVFAALRFIGRRFEDHLLRVEVMSELVAYRELVLWASRLLFFIDNPKRQRVRLAPFDLVLADVKEGSTMPVLALVEPPPALDGRQATLFADEWQTEQKQLFQRARDELMQVVQSGKGMLEHAFKDGAPEPQHSAGLGLLQGFQNFGRSLLDDEAIGLNVAKSEVQYTAQKGRRLAERYVGEYEKPTTIRGSVRAANRDTSTFQVKRADGSVASVFVPPLFFRVGARTMTEIADEQSVEVEGLGLFKNGQLRRVQAERVSLIPDTAFALRETPTTPVVEQLRDLRALKDGWHDGEGVAPKPEVIDGAADVLSFLEETFSVPLPFLYPTFDGAVRAEWSGPAWHVVLEMRDKDAHLIATAFTGPQTFERTESIDKAGLVKLGEELVIYLRGMQ